MARPKNYDKQIESLQKKLDVLNAKYDEAKASVSSIGEERQRILEEISQIKILQIQQLMDEKGVSVDELREMLENK